MLEKKKKIEGGIWRLFEHCHSAEKCKRGTFWDFLTSILLQNIETNEGAPFGREKFSRKVYSREKNLSEKHQDPPNAKGGFLVCFRGSGRQFCFGRAFEVRVF